MPDIVSCLLQSCVSPGAGMMNAHGLSSVSGFDICTFICDTKGNCGPPRACVSYKTLKPNTVTKLGQILSDNKSFCCLTTRVLRLLFLCCGGAGAALGLLAALVPPLLSHGQGLGSRALKIKPAALPVPPVRDQVCQGVKLGPLHLT